MIDKGVSKKTHIVSLCITAVIGMATNAPNKLPYAIIIGAIGVIYWAIQCFLDWSNNGKENK